MVGASPPNPTSSRRPTRRRRACSTRPQRGAAPKNKELPVTSETERVCPSAMKTPRFPQALVASSVMLLAACDSDDQQPLTAADLIDDVDGPTTGAVDPGALDDEAEDDLIFVPLVQFPEDDDGSDLDDFEAAADAGPQQVGVISGWSWGTSGNNGPRKYLGSAATQTCFLQGITGELESDPDSSLTARAGVYIDPNNNEWYIETKAGVPTYWGEGGSGVMAHVSCIANTTNRQMISWAGNANGTVDTLYSFAEDHGNTRCFLTSVSGSVGWASPSAWTGLRQDVRDGEPTWELDGNLVQKTSGGSGGGSSAVCVDISFQYSPSYDYQAPSNTGVAQIGEVAGTTCAVHSLVGNFAANDSYGWNDGVRIIPWVGSWYAYGNSSKRIKGECYKNYPIVPGW